MLFRQLISLACALALIAAVSAHTNKAKKQSKPAESAVISSDQTLGSEIKSEKVVIDKSQLKTVLQPQTEKSPSADKS
jgi:hypothetical protein